MKILRHAVYSCDTCPFGGFDPYKVGNSDPGLSAACRHPEAPGKSIHPNSKSTAPGCPLKDAEMLVVFEPPPEIKVQTKVTL